MWPLPAPLGPCQPRANPTLRNVRHMELTSPRAVVDALGSTGYLADDDLATVVFLADAMQRPLLLEGEPGTGKTALAEALAELQGVPLIRLQCYEGIDATQALYDWDFPRQILHLRTLEAATKAGDLDPAEAEKSLFDERFLLARPVLQALRESPAVLLIDEVDRADDEFEAFLLEVLSSWTVSIPELGTVTAAVPPTVVLTSNRTRELHDALKRRCLYHWIDHPGLQREVEIVRGRLPEVTQRLAEQVVSAVQRLRQEQLLKPPGVAETLDWTRALQRLGAEELDLETAARTLGTVVKYREDTDRVKQALDRMLAG
ncbi:MoxR family ATPase [Nocardioides korecus]